MIVDFLFKSVVWILVKLRIVEEIAITTPEETIKSFIRRRKHL